MNYLAFPISFLLLLVLALQLASCSQPCNLTPEQAPEIRGFRLLMTVEEIQAKYKNFPTPKANELGVAKVVVVNSLNFKPEDLQRPNEVTFVRGGQYPELLNTSHIYLDIVDGRVARIKVFYPNELKWTSVDEFVNKTAESFGLKGSWEKVNQDYRVLHCSGGVSFLAGIDKDYDQRDSREKLPYLEIIASMLYMKQLSREYNKNVNANLKEKERRDEFKP